MRTSPSSSTRCLSLAVAAAVIALLALGDAPARAQTGICFYQVFTLVADALDRGEQTYQEIAETLQDEAHAKLRAEAIGWGGVWREASGVKTFYPASRIVRVTIMGACAPTSAAPAR